jgi:glycosyltransferase involved in cell wall biosynthesis
VRESIVDGVNGFLVNEDESSLFGQILEKLIDSRGLAHDLGLKARAAVIANWNLSKATDAIESRLQSLLISAQKSGS